MLAYAIYYVTVVNVSDDYSFLTLGIITGATAVSVIGMHEWFRHQYGKDRVENPIEEYGGAIAVLMGALSAVWLSRFAVFYGKEMSWIEVQDGEVWMPVWLAALQTAAILLVMEISTFSIRRHSLGTLPRTVVVLAPLAVVFSGVKIWLEYSRGELEGFITISVVLLTGSAILYSLRLDRAVLYLLASGAAVGLPIFMALSSWGETEHASLLVPAVVLVGITATDRSLSKRMIENGSGAVVAAILFCQIIAADGTHFIIAGLTLSEEPFGLTFWLWVALLVGWFAPTTMQRTPAMPVGLALALALLSDEAAMVAWFVGLSAFVYLETHPLARDWVVRATYVAMVASWTVSSFIGAGDSEGNILDFGGLTLSVVDGLSLVLFPAILALGIWAQSRHRLRFYEGPSVLLLLASFNVDLIEEAHLLFVGIILVATLYQLNSFLRIRSESEESQLDWGIEIAFMTLIVSPVVLSTLFSSFDLQSDDVVSRALPLIAASGLFGICHRWRKEGESLSLRPEMAAILFLIFVFLMSNIDEASSTDAIRMTLACTALAAALLAFEGGAAFHTTPLERLIGISYLSIVSLISAVIISEEGADMLARSTRDLLIIAAPVIVNFRLKTLLDLSQEARNFGTLTLSILLIIGLTDTSGGLLAIPVFAIAVQRAAKHVSTPVLACLPIFAVIYASLFHSNHDANDIIWNAMAELPYLGETTDLLAFDTPRWASILLFSIPAAVAFYLPIERAREEGSRFGPEQLFGPALALLMGIAFLLPDPRTAPIMIVAILTYVAWKNGVVLWFWVSPIAWFWASSQLFDYMGDGSIEPELARVVGGLAGFFQYALVQRGVLLQNAVRDEAPEQAQLFDKVGSASRVYGYSFFLLSGELTGALPFIAALFAAWDGLRNGIPLLLHGSVFVQSVTLWDWISEDFSSTPPDNALLWPIAIGIAMVYISWSRKDPYGSGEMMTIMSELSEDDSFDIEKDFGLFGSAFFLVAMLLYSAFIDFEIAFGISIVILSLHHVVVGFSRDHGWRRMMSLVGMPSGLIYTGLDQGELTLVLMLFLAALTLIGQAVLYASRGGLEIGSTIEGATPFVSEVGVRDPEPEEPLMDKDELPDPEPSELSDQSEEIDSPSEKEEYDSEPVEARPHSPLFASEKAPFGIRLDPPLVSNLRAMIDANNSVDFSQWSPVLGISSNGAIILNWERNSSEEE